MTDSIRSIAPTLSLHARAAALSGSAARMVSIAPVAPIASPAPPIATTPAPGPRLRQATSGDRYTPSAAAAPSLRDHLTALSVNSAALSTLGAVDSLLAEHFGGATTSRENH